MSNSTLQPQCPRYGASAPSGWVPVSSPNTINYCILDQMVDSNTTAAMQQCCASDPVQIAGGCYNWCELPERYLNASGKDFTTSNVASAFSSCLAAEGLGEFGLQCFVPSASAASARFQGASMRLSGLGVFALMMWHLWC